MTTGTDTSSLPSAAKTLIKQLPDGWTHAITHGTGAVDKQRNDPDLRKRIITAEPCTSVAVRLRNPAGRAAVAVWVDGSFDSAYSWWLCRDEACPKAGSDHPADLPQKLDLAALKAYLTAPSLAAYRAQLDALATKKKAAAEKAAATRAAKKRAAQDISTSSVATEEAA
jgi:hypothetical protein